MFRLIIFIAFIGLGFSFVHNPQMPTQIMDETYDQLDTVPSANEALLQELLSTAKNKTWRDSGYYFQLETVFWTATRIGTTSNGDGIILANFSSADPSSLRYRGQAVFRFDPNSWPENIMPSRGMQGEALIAFPQDVLLCPSPSQEAGLGQNDPYFPLYLSGQITGVNGNVNDAPGLIKFDSEMSVQLRDMEIIL